MSDRPTDSQRAEAWLHRFGIGPMGAEFMIDSLTAQFAEVRREERREALEEAALACIAAHGGHVKVCAHRICALPVEAGEGDT